MGARIGGESHRFLSPVVPDFLLKEREDFLLKERELMGSGKKSIEWDLNDWKWDGNLFLASPLKSDPPDCRNKQFLPAGSRIPANAGLSNSSSSCSDEIDVEGGRGKGELEKRRRVVMVKEDKLNDEAGSLTLNLGGHFYPVTEAEVANLEGKKNNLQGLNASRSVCQVEGCGADLSNSRDYHRRHKVCEMHSKATEALVGNVMQRFCQQCSRLIVG